MPLLQKKKKEIRVIALAICFLKNPDAFVWQEAEQENCSRCDSSKEH